MITKKIHDPLFCDTDSAFKVFYSDDVVIEHITKTGEKLTYCTKSYVCDDGIEISEESEIRKDVELWIVTINLNDWSYNNIPDIGDTVTYVNDDKVNWKISRVIKADETLRCFCRSR